MSLTIAATRQQMKTSELNHKNCAKVLRYCGFSVTCKAVGGEKMWEVIVKNINSNELAQLKEIYPNVNIEKA